MQMYGDFPSIHTHTISGDAWVVLESWRKNYDFWDFQKFLKCLLINKKFFAISYQQSKRVERLPVWRSIIHILTNAIINQMIENIGNGNSGLAIWYIWDDSSIIIIMIIVTALLMHIHDQCSNYYYYSIWKFILQIHQSNRSIGQSNRKWCY